MHPWVEQAKIALEPLANVENAAAMKAYMRGQFNFYGIKSGPRREAVKPLFSASACPSVDTLPQVVDELWALPEREYQLLAIDLLIKFKKTLTGECFGRLRALDYNQTLVGYR